MVHKEPYVPGTKIGPIYIQLMKKAAEQMGKERGNDDYILINVGTAGSGKSHLGMHTYEAVSPELDIDQIALTKEDLARAFKKSTLTNGFRFVQYDEGKLNKREWNTHWSRDLLELYHDVRELNIFHIWCTAMPNLIDREFVDARVKGLVYIYTKGEDYRRFLLFTKQDLLRFMDANDNKLSFKLLKKYGDAFARLDSYFTEYDGELSKEYSLKKKDRMTSRVDEFYEKYAKEKTYNKKQAAKWLGRSYMSFYNAMKAGLIPNQHTYVLYELKKIGKETGWRK